MWLTIISAWALGALLVYIWAAVSVYVVSFGIPQFENIRFADRALYAIKWPLYPIMAVVVMGVMAYNFLKVALGKNVSVDDIKPPDGGMFAPNQEGKYKQ